MLNSEKKVTIEWENGNNASSTNMSNPITCSDTDSNKKKMMISQVLSEEIPQIKANSLLHNIIVYSLLEKMNTVQNIENVLSYIKGNDAKTVQDVSFKNGEIRIKCSV